MNRQGRFYNGVLLLNKPTGITSHDAVLKIRREIHQRRVGHTGTLDLRAEGLIVMCLGRATKISQFVCDFDKVYEAELCLGRRSKTYDGEGIFGNQMPMKVPDMTDEEAQNLLNEYKGIIQQQVPAYSAVRVDGQRLHELAREGVEVDPPVREVEIKDIQLTSYKNPYLSFRTNCSKGTYVRSLANDIGNRLGCGAYLSRLRRISVGSLTLDKAITLSEVSRYHVNSTLGKHLLSVEKVLRYSAVRVTDAFRQDVISGPELTPEHVVAIEGDFSVGDKVMLKDAQGTVLAVGKAEADADRFRAGDNGEKLFSYIRVLN